ncbi:MAG: hypothetical protein GF334_05150 [Candidatus Altiarchaeales archaeon]|nr:hypothetical protein [Candidatus Altiarchaeales archaeon]
MADKKYITDLIDPALFKDLLKQIQDSRKVIESRKLTDIDGVEYGSVEHIDKDKSVKYTIRGVHVPMDKIFKYARGNCNTCNSKGYTVVHIDKKYVKEPGDYVLVSSEPVDGLSKEEMGIWREKMAREKAWRAMLPCQCALKKALKKEPDLYANELGNIIVRIEYEEVPLDEGA